MVRGLDVFRHHFEAYADRYVLIGGTACDIVLDQAGLPFRSTKDFDIVLSAEAMDAEFATAFRAFVRAGRYSNRQRSTGRRLFYRFYDPEDTEYPWMLELFSRKPDAMQLPDDAQLTPVPVAEEASSLSAILMDLDYYAFIHANRQELDGVSVARPEALIPLKARAWLDLSARKAVGERIDETDIRKHRSDVFRLYRVIDPATELSIPDAVRADMTRFIDMMDDVDSVHLRNLGMKGTTREAVQSELARIYGLDL